jgi:hypothetical protein
VTIADTVATVAITTDTTENKGQRDDVSETSKCNPSGRVEAIYAQPFTYREMKRKDIRNADSLTGLFCGKDGCYLKHAKISFVDGFNECAGVSTLTLKSNAMFLFSKFIDYNTDKIQYVSLGKDVNCERCKIMLPNKKFTFAFGDTTYELKAFGKTTGGDDWTVENYSLVYSIMGAENKQTIVRIPHINYTVVRLWFIGDLDGDGKPDIILDAPSDYEEEIIMLFLSSTAKDGEYLRCEDINSNQFDC